MSKPPFKVRPPTPAEQSELRRWNRRLASFGLKAIKPKEKTSREKRGQQARARHRHAKPAL